MNIKATQPQKTLLIRVDRIGDLVCTLPIDQLPALKNHKCSWLITRGLEFIPENSVPKRNYESVLRYFSWKNLFQLCRWLRQEQFSLSISFHAPWWINLALWICRVPKRIGNHSQWHSFVFFTQGLRQKRHQSTLHEAEYNQQVIEKLLQQKTTPLPHLQLTLSKINQENENSLNKYNLKPQSYIVIHPGMGGSALNWPTLHYVQLIEQLIQTDRVVITGTHSDNPWLSPIQEKLTLNSTVNNLQWLNTKLSSSELLTVLSQAKVVIAPSTGVAHLAASLGTPTIGLYPLTPTQSPTRWSPRGPIVRTLTPPKEFILNHEQMKYLSVNTVLNSLKNF